MKVNGNDSNSSDVAKLQQQATQSSSSSVTAQQKKLSAKLAEEGSVKVGLASLINREFDSTKIDGERRARVEELKKLIASGNYNPDSFAVAQSLSNELSLSILTEGSALSSKE